MKGLTRNQAEGVAKMIGLEPEQVKRPSEGDKSWWVIDTRRRTLIHSDLERLSTIPQFLFIGANNDKKLDIWFHAENDSN